MKNMKKLILLISLLLTINIAFSQNFYKEYKPKEFNSIIREIDESKMRMEIHKDSVVKGELYIKYNLTGYYKNDSLVKIKIRIDNKLSIYDETFYFDKQGFLIYIKTSEYSHGYTISTFEAKLYSKDKLIFLLDETPTNYKLSEKNELIKQIKKDVKFYKTYFK